MKLNLSIVGTILVLSTHGAMADSFLTKADINLLCESPINLRESFKAFPDEKWLDEIGCTWMPANYPVTLIQRSGDYWQVRIKSKDGRIGMTLWGNGYSFTPPIQ